MLLGKKEYEIKFTMNTLCMMAEQGLEIAKVTEGGMQNLPLTEIPSAINSSIMSPAWFLVSFLSACFNP